MKATKTAAFLKRLIRFGRVRRTASIGDRVDPADLGTAFGLETSLMAEGDKPLVHRPSARERVVLRPRQR